MVDRNAGPVVPMGSVRSCIVLAANVLLVTAACGGSSAPDTTEEPPPPPASSVTLAPALADTDPPTTEPPAPATDAGQTGRKVILDYSPTVSDVGALLYLLTSPEVDVVAITLPAAGEAGCELGLQVTLGVLALLDRGDVPVACDPDRPDHAGEWPAAFLAGMESLTTGLPAITTAAESDVTAPQLIADVVAASEEPVTLLAVAPLTNVARALDRAPELVDRLEQIVIMGGAIDAAGNVDGSAAEWNIWIDVPSAAEVFASGAPITLVPLDATNDVPVPAFWQRDLQLAEQSPAIEYLAGLVDIFPAVTSGFFYLWDELAASVAVGDNPVAVRRMQLTVLDETGAEYGRTARAPGAAPVAVATSVGDPQGFYDDFLATLAGAPVDRSSVVLNVDLPPSSVAATSTPVEVLSYWLDGALDGDTSEAASLVAPGSSWIGFGGSPEAFVEGSAPYGAADASFACTEAGTIAWCDVEWTDDWIAAIPELDHGTLQVQAEVVDGRIVAFQRFSFGDDVTSAFERHTAWLQSQHPERLAEACANPASASCGELLVSTVDEWVAGR